jgi:hypothetical protein
MQRPSSPNRLPVACGALGAFDGRVVERIAANLAPDLTEVHRDEISALWIDRLPIGWQDGASARGIAWSERLPAHAHGARSWREAARAGALGLAIEEARRTVHASESGAGPLYWTASGGAIYFATAVAPLAAAAPGSLAPDWESWASIVTLGYPCGDGSPFAEVHRLDPLGTLTVAGRGAPTARAGDLAWAAVEPDDAPDLPGEVVARVRHELDLLDGSRELICPLTGGFDSRLLACLIADAGRDLQTFTINKDLGNEREEELAGAVAASLGLPHSVLAPGGRPFADELRMAAELLDYEAVLRLYLARLACALPNPSAIVVEGFDIFLKNIFATREVLGAANWRDGAAIMFDQLTPAEQRFPIFEREAWSVLRAATRPRWTQGAERFDGHPSASTLTPYWHRMRRGIGASPTRLLGARHEVAIPLLGARFVRTALRASPEAKFGGAFYRRVLEVANAEVAPLPSTNDELPPPRRTRKRLERSPQARRVYLELLAESPLRPWFSAEMELALERGKLGPLLRSGWGMGRVHALCYLTLWARRHRDRLGELDPTPLLGSR